MTSNIRDIESPVPIYSQSYTIAQGPSNGQRFNFGSGASSSMDARVEDLDLRFNNFGSSSLIYGRQGGVRNSVQDHHQTWLGGGDLKGNIYNSLDEDDSRSFNKLGKSKLICTMKEATDSKMQKGAQSRQTHNLESKTINLTMQRSRLDEDRRNDINKRIEEFKSDDEEDSEIVDKQSIPVGSGDPAL